MSTSSTDPRTLTLVPGLLWPGSTDAPDAPDGPPAVLLHGYGGGASAWRNVAEHARTRPLIAFDLPGHAGAPIDEGATFEDGVAAIAHAWERQGLSRGVLAGYSLGARLALSLALRHPERVSGLLVVGVHPGLGAQDERRARLEADRAWARCLREEGLDAFFARWDAQPLFASRRGDRRALRAAHDAQALALAMETFSQGAMPDHRPRLGDLTMPAIVMAGARDAKFVALAREVVTAMPRARLDIVPDAGHDLLSERPHEVARALDQIQEASRA